MSYQNISDTEIVTGKPVRSSTASKIKNNLDDHEERLLNLEAGGDATYPPLILRVSGSYKTYVNMEIGLKTTINFPITLAGARLIIDKAGTVGTTEIDIQYKRGAGSWTSVFTTKPSVAYSEGNDATSSNAVLDAANDDLLAGDLIRLVITSAQTGGHGFMVRVDFNRT